MTSLTSRAQSVLASLSARPRHSYGQNFMVSEPALADIARNVAAGPGDTVLEVGPGLGFLTERILPQAGKVFAVEKDRLFVPYLRKRFESDPRLEVIEADILNWDPVPTLPEGAKMVGNIPYQISSPLLEWTEARRNIFTEAHFTLQKEFAERLATPPGERETSALSVWMHLNAEISVRAHIARTAFYPEPKVDSQLVRIRFFSKPLYPPGAGDMLRGLIKKAFQQRRKMLSNTLGAPLLEAAGVPRHLRPEELTLENWISLGKAGGGLC